MDLSIFAVVDGNKKLRLNTIVEPDSVKIQEYYLIVHKEICKQSNRSVVIHIKSTENYFSIALIFASRIILTFLLGCALSSATLIDSYGSTNSTDWTSQLTGTQPI